MALPKGFRNDIRLTSPNVGVQRRQDLLDNIADDGTFLPRGVHYQDMDETFIKFVNKELNIEIDGEGVPVVFLTLQRYAEFTKTWKFTDEYKNIKIPFITIVRKPDPQVGTNQAGLYNIPGRPTFTYYKVPTNDGARVGVDLYKIPQPTSVDITYEVRMFTNKMSDLNLLNEKVQKKFQSKQAYIWPKGHPMPVTLEGIGDESNIDDFENRRFYVQPFEMLLAGYILDEEDFEIMPTINRAMVMSELIVSDGVTTPVTDGRNSPGCVVAAQGSSIIKNTAGTVLSVVECGSNYVVGNSLVFNSGSTYSQIIPATTNLELPNVINIDSDGSSVLTPAMVGFTASTCDPVTIINSGATYTASTAAGTTFELPNQVIDIENETGGTINTITFPVYSDPTIDLTAYCQSVIVNNSGGTFNQTIEPGSAYTLPNVTNIDIDGSSVLTPAQTPFTASTCPAPSDVYIRPSEWLAMPSLSDGDDKIVLLVAVWENASNFITLKPTTSSGTYTINWGDGNTSSGITSGAQSDHAFDYTGLSADTSAYGYRQSIVTITADSGNLTGMNNYNISNPSKNTQYSTGVLECNIASQSILSLANAFRSQYAQKFPWLERFEFIGTCNVTAFSYAFMGSGIKYFKATAPNATTAAQSFMSSSIEFLHGKLGSGLCAGTSMFYKTHSIKEIPSTFDMTGINNLQYAIYNSEISSFGTVENPVALKDGVTTAQFARSAPHIREMNIGSGYFTGNVGLMFYQSKMITAIRGLNGTAITSLSQAFTQAYSLQTLDSSNIAVSFDLSSCNFATQGLVDIFNDLPDLSGGSATITVTNNPGTAGLSSANILIAEDKDWTVTV